MGVERSLLHLHGLLETERAFVCKPGFCKTRFLLSPKSASFIEVTRTALAYSHIALPRVQTAVWSALFSIWGRHTSIGICKEI
jgi:hypothetical protein